MDVHELLCNHIVPCVDALSSLRYGGDAVDGLDGETARDVERLAQDAHDIYDRLHEILRKGSQK